MNTRDDRVIAFRRLHSSGCFVMPNPWDVGGARALEQMGFKALATTSAGFAWTLGRADYEVTPDVALEHLRLIADAVAVPVNADFQGGFADDPEQVNANVKLAVATGIAGLSIEDSTGDDLEPLYEFNLAIERVRAARQAIDEAAQASFSPVDQKGSWLDAPTSTRRSEGSGPMPKLAPIAFTLRGSITSNTLPPSSPRYHPSR